MPGVSDFPPVSDDVLLGDLGEHAIVEHILRPRYGGVPAFGDDCALLDGSDGLRGSDLVATTDSCPTPLVTILGETDPYHTGWLLVTINVSDLAAAGATPLGLVVNYTLPKTTTAGEFRRLLDGVDDCAETHGTRIVGGDLRDGPVRQLTATAIGRCVPGGRLGRTGSEVGDRLLLVGSPGYLWAYALLAEEQARLPEPLVDEIRERACRPMAQLTAGRLLATAGLARAAMDVSDGLFPTVRTLCRANGLGAVITTDIQLDDGPADVCAQAGLGRFDLAQAWGDWTLVVAVRSDDVELARKTLAAEGVAAQEIGTFVPREAGIALDDGTPWEGIAQERFSPSSWHGGDLSRLIADVLGRQAPSGS
ncbi:thiamine-phosphate kinase [Amycolatopsis alba]|uniref:Thiamine-monophosphate kinase n=1 Tax=Amycolatopsis alba DSM 44262 TaxID=1125972 RepID=A0A229RS14_AMYAL|nr:thiamine-phosphate kinase [Amycolatopsis alba]OXM49463.1 thiamine-monophosphate kinase [Amycolatopsis alba DSM 44262]